MTALSLTITDAGRAALVAAAGTAAVTITEAGVSASVIVAAPTLTALPGEIKRIAAVSGEAVDVTTVHLTIRDSSTDAYDVRAIALYLDDGTLFAVYAQPDPILGKAEVSTMFLACDLTFVAGEADLVQFGDANFTDPPASESVKGVAYLATIAEALAGAVADKIITPATMKAVLDNYVAADQLGVPDGVATLGPDGKLALAQRPPIDLIDVFPVADEAAMLALDATSGDFAVRADTGLVFVLQATPATLLANWLEISTPAPVSSVNGKVGAVLLTPADIGAVPATRAITGAGLLAGQGGNLLADRIFNLVAASAAEAVAGAIADKVVTPASLATILAQLAAKASAAGTVTGAGLVSGGGALSANPVLSVLAATAADIQAGTSNTLAVTPAGLAALPRSVTPNGYAVLPGGLIVQWVRYRGIITTESTFFVSFPTTFPTVALPVAITGYNADFSISRDLWPQLLGTPTTSGCVVQTQSDDGRDMRIDGFDLIVLGF